ncbi:hypothetical protein ZIOFF_070917 [Zingiber officinale]|uniref:EF-hand domain-containing protein n=1 Tax=Zingiber officinale TaxID=94328 RepID=A0A8J5C377_ZINOF|nr:hypothetical protein ZIOFF_070917 [Zingiber officinale]
MPWRSSQPPPLSDLLCASHQVRPNAGCRLIFCALGAAVRFEPTNRFTAATVGQIPSPMPLIWSNYCRASTLCVAESRELEKATKGISDSAVGFKIHFASSVSGFHNSCDFSGHNFQQHPCCEKLDHPWLQNANKAPNVNLGETVRARLQQFSVMNKFKKKALRVIAEHLSVEEIADIKEMFENMDINKKGQINFDELKYGLHKLRHQVADSDVKALLEAVSYC